MIVSRICLLSQEICLTKNQTFFFTTTCFFTEQPSTFLQMSANLAARSARFGPLQLHDPRPAGQPPAKCRHVRDRAVDRNLRLRLQNSAKWLANLCPIFYPCCFASSAPIVANKESVVRIFKSNEFGKTEIDICRSP